MECSWRQKNDQRLQHRGVDEEKQIKAQRRGLTQFDEGRNKWTIDLQMHSSTCSLTR